jgi:hypothetical protein
LKEGNSEREKETINSPDVLDYDNGAGFGLAVLDDGAGALDQASEVFQVDSIYIYHCGFKSIVQRPGVDKPEIGFHFTLVLLSHQAVGGGGHVRVDRQFDCLHHEFFFLSIYSAPTDAAGSGSKSGVRLYHHLYLVVRGDECDNSAQFFPELEEIAVGGGTTEAREGEIRL